MSDIVLVHGAFAGGYVWQRVADLLRRDGHRVWAPTLTGLGERRHLLTGDVNLETHIRDIEAVLYYEDITDAAIVAHSYAGMVVAGLGDDAAARISTVIYLDAALPRDGESIHELLGAGATELPPGLAELHDAERRDEAQLVIALDPVAAEDPRLSPQPVSTHWARVALGPVLRRAGTKVYVECLQTRATRRTSPVRAAQDGWTVRELQAPHNAPVECPTQVAALIAEVLAST